MRFATCKRTSSDLVVQNDLALTPAQMMKMAEKGVPISAQQAPDGQFDLGSENPYVPLERRRGIDISDLWNAEQSAKSKFKDAVKAEKILNGSFKTLNPLTE